MLATAGAILLKTLAGLGMSLLTESFLKDIIVLGLEKLAQSTQTDADDRLVADVKKAWGLAPSESKGK